MTDTPIIERIDSDLEPLMERFFINSEKDLVEMRTALNAGDFETLARLGHTAKGTGYGYGLMGMGDIGLALENASKIGDVAEVTVQVACMASYLANVQVEFGE